MNHAKWLDFYRIQIERASRFPPPTNIVDQADSTGPVSPGFPDPSQPSHGPTVSLTGHLPSEQRVLR